MSNKNHSSPTTLNASMTSLPDTVIEGRYPIHSKHLTTASTTTPNKLTTRLSEADVTERTWTSSTHVSSGEDYSTTEISESEYIREVPFPETTTGTKAPGIVLNAVVDETEVPTDFFQAEEEDVFGIFVDSPARPITACTGSSPDSVYSSSPESITADPHNFPRTADIMDESLQRLHRAVQEQLQQSFTAARNKDRLRLHRDDTTTTTSSSGVSTDGTEELFLDEDTLDTNDDTLDTNESSTDAEGPQQHVRRSRDKSHKKKKKKKKGKKSKKRKTERKSSSHNEEENSHADETLAHKRAPSPPDLPPLMPLAHADVVLLPDDSEDEVDDGLGVTSGLDDTMHFPRRSRVDPPGERAKAVYDDSSESSDTTTPEKHHGNRKRSKKKASKHHKKRRTSSPSSSKRKEPKTPPTRSSKSTSDLISSLPPGPSEWQVAKERLHRAVSVSPNRPFVAPIRKRNRCAVWLDDDLSEAQSAGLRDLRKKRLPPPPLLEEEDVVTETGRDEDGNSPELLSLDSFDNSADKLDPFSIFTTTTDSPSSSTGRSLREPDVEHGIIFPVGYDYDDDGTNPTLNGAVLDKSDSKDSVGWRERILYYMCRLFIVAGLAIIIFAIVTTARNRRDDDASADPVTTMFATETPTVAPVLGTTATSTPLPTANQKARREWTVQGQVLQGSQASEQFGSSVALSTNGNTLAVGAIRPSDLFGRVFDGYVQVLSFDDASAQWMPMGEILQNEEDGDDYGYSVSLSADGRTLAASVIANNLSGRGNGQARVFRYDEPSMKWEQVGQDQFTGFWHDNVVLSDDGNTVAFVRNTDVTGENTAVVSHFIGGEWKPLGQELGGLPGGVSVTFIDLSADGRTVAIGGDAYDANTLVVLGGIIRILRYNEDADAWETLGQDVFGLHTYDGFGAAFALNADGTMLVAGAANHNTDDLSNAGQVRVLEYDETAGQWYPRGQAIVGEEESEMLGSSVAISADGGTVAVGSPSGQGHLQVYVFDDATKSWMSLGGALEGTADDDKFGYAVALSDDGQSVVGSSRLHDSNGEDAGQVRVYRIGP